MTIHNIIVIGDVVVDEFILLRSKSATYEKGHLGEPIPQYDIVGIQKRLGGAFNVAYLLQRRLINTSVKFYTSAPSEIVGPLTQDCEDIIGDVLDANPASRISVKRRYIDHEFYHSKERHDYYKKMRKCTPKDVLDWVRNIPFSDADLVIISDYRKGLFDRAAISTIIANSKMCVVDTKDPDIDKFVGADFIKLNHQEFINVHEFYGVENAPEHFVPHKLIVTCGADDTRFIYSEVNDKEVTGFDVRAKPRMVDKTGILDCVGAGDAFVAGFSWGLLEHEGGVMQAIDDGHWLAKQSLEHLGAIW